MQTALLQKETSQSVTLKVNLILTGYELTFRCLHTLSFNLILCVCVCVCEWILHNKNMIEKKLHLLSYNISSLQINFLDTPVAVPEWQSPLSYFSGL
jgi:hypothetical protein